MQQIIRTALESKKPLAIGKIGGTEGKALSYYANHFTRILRKKKIQRMSQKLYLHSGVYPPDLATYKRFYAYWREKVLPCCDYLADWRPKESDRRLAKQCNFNPIWIKQDLLSPQNGWLSTLNNYSIAVISPFVNSIQSQIPKLRDIWPQYSIDASSIIFHVIKAPHYAHLVPPTHTDWFQALDALSHQLKELEYDLLLVGAGAWGLPLAVEAKRQGKIGIHLGGQLQITFGITGARWGASVNERPEYMNQHWITPLESDKPQTLASAKQDFLNDCAYW